MVNLRIRYSEYMKSSFTGFMCKRIKITISGKLYVHSLPSALSICDYECFCTFVVKMVISQWCLKSCLSLPVTLWESVFTITVFSITAWVILQHTYSQTSYFLRLTLHSDISDYKVISGLKQWFYLQSSCIRMRILSWKAYYSCLLVKWLSAGGVLEVCFRLIS